MELLTHRTLARVPAAGVFGGVTERPTSTACGPHGAISDSLDDGWVPRGTRQATLAPYNLAGSAPAGLHGRSPRLASPWLVAVHGCTVSPVVRGAGQVMNTNLFI